MFSKEDIEKAIEVVKEEIEYIQNTDSNATVEIEILEFTITSLEGYRDRESIMAWIREQEALLAKSNVC